MSLYLGSKTWRGHGIFGKLIVHTKTGTFTNKKYIFGLIFGLANAINNYFRLKIRVVCGENF
jgi:hypothetical protein